MATTPPPGSAVGGGVAAGIKDKSKAKKPPSTKAMEDYADSLNLGWSIAFFKSIPEIWTLFSKAMQKGIQPTVFAAQVRNSKWYRTHSATFRTTWAMQFNQPATFAETLKQIKAQMEDMAGSMGVVMNDKQMTAAAKSAMFAGWNENQMRNALAHYTAQVNSGGYGGEAGAAEDDLRSYAAKMGVQIGDSQLKGWLGNILRGTQTAEGYKKWIEGEAIKAFPQMKDQIKAGNTVADMASPFIQSMSSILELNPASINMFDPTIRKAMSSQDPNAPGTMMPMYQFENQLRNDPRWMYTNNARTSINQIGLGVLKDFGFQA